MVKKYRTTFLEKVIVRLDYSYPITQLTKTLPKQLKTIPRFPISEPKEFIGKELLVSKGVIKEETTEGTTWFFHSIDRQKTLAIDRDNFNISYKTFDNFDVLKQDFLPIVEVLFGIYEDIQGKRLGLRYINEIKLDENDVLDWSEYLDGKLLTHLEFPEDPSLICRAFNDLELNYGDFVLKFQYGIRNSDYPARIQKKSFILDYDAYSTGLQDLGDITQNLDKLNEAIHKIFEQSIRDGLRNKMGVGNNG